MPKEEGPRGIPLTAIHIDLQERAVIFEAENTPVAKLTLASAGVIYEALSSTAHPGTGDTAGISPPQAASVDATTGKEREPTITVTGRLKSTPREGRPDRSGNPTAWARLAVHDEATDGLKLYSATFHRHTATIALDLPKDAQITVQAYAHPVGDPSRKRLDTLSVINLVAYPGKPDKG